MGFFDTGCDRKNCIYCEVNRIALFSLKGGGLCGKGTKLDSQYVLNSDVTFAYLPVLTGFTSSQIIFNTNASAWQIENRFTGETLASLRDTSMMPFGVHSWHLDSKLKCGTESFMMLR